MFANNGRCIIEKSPYKLARSSSAPSAERMPHPQEDWSNVLAANAQAQQGRSGQDHTRHDHVEPHIPDHR
jgi:hypothetical protein